MRTSTLLVSVAAGLTAGALLAALGERKARAAVPSLLPPYAGPARDRAILDAADRGAIVPEWVELQASARLVIAVTGDSLKLGGVRLNVSAIVQQQLADKFEALLPTPKMMDLMWLARSATLLPVLADVTDTSTELMAHVSSLIDAQLVALGRPTGLLPSQKTWAIGNSLLAHPGRAMNYGLFVIPDAALRWRGIATEAAVSIADPKLGRVIQGQGWRHTPTHEDYSQEAWLARRACRLDGAPADLAAVLRDPALAPTVSHEGVLHVLRQPY